MNGNGHNNWNVRYSHISWFERLLRNHENSGTFTRHDDLVFELNRKKQADRLSIVCLDEYTMGLTAVQRVICEFGKPSIIYIGGGWCSYTKEAKEFCFSERIGLYVTNEMQGALWATEYWAYRQRDRDGDPVDYFSRQQA